MRDDFTLVMRVPKPGLPLAQNGPAPSAPCGAGPILCVWLGCTREAVEGDLCLSHADMAADLIAESRERWARFDERQGS